MSAEEARAEWETANTYLRGARRGDEWICHTSLEEPWNELSDRYPRQATAFMEKIWPRVLAAVRADLQAPASTVATNEPGSYPRATDAQIRAMAIRRARFAELVEQERKRQDEKWGKNIVPLDRMLVVLGEEFGEACRGALELAKPGGFENLQDELVQVGAVASKIYELLLILDLARVDENLERRARGGGA